MKEHIQLQAKLGRFKDKHSVTTNQTISSLSADIEDLKRQVVENHKIADIVLLEVKAVFLKNLALLQSIPQPIPEEKHLQFKTREILIATPGHAGTGNDYLQPAKPAFDNPIWAVHHVSKDSVCLKFETQDGVTGKHNPEPS